jgi:ATP-dependent helicase STH1/SNF2
MIKRGILEADQEEESEESGDMNDEEINEMISRSEEETIKYNEMDAQRDREAAEQWKAAGNRGKPPPYLIQLEELPQCYRTDEAFEKVEEDEGPEGRGARKRTVVSYNDGLSDEQWAMVSSYAEECFLPGANPLAGHRGRRGHRGARRAYSCYSWPADLRG